MSNDAAILAEASERSGARAPAASASLHQIVVVGGGAGGLELVTALGNKLGKRRKAAVTRNLMGGLVGGSPFIEGYFARLMYRSLYKMHELALHGAPKVALDTIARLITRRTEPHVKLH
jgi:hypothetical protein